MALTSRLATKIIIYSIAGGLVAFAMPVSADTPPPSVTVTGEAIAKLAPDQATLPITIQAEHKELASAKQAADKLLKAALAKAKEFGIPDSKIQTQYTQITPQYDYPQQGGGKPVFRNYMANIGLELTLNDLTKLAPLTEALVGVGIDRIGSVQFGLADEKKARDSLLAQAVADARNKANAMAQALGVKAGKPLQINENGGNIAPPRPMMMKRQYDMAAAGVAQESAPDLPSGQLEIRQAVSVTFALE